MHSYSNIFTVHKQTKHVYYKCVLYPILLKVMYLYTIQMTTNKFYKSKSIFANSPINSDSPIMKNDTLPM